MHRLALRFHRRRRPALHSSGFPVDTQNITYAHLAGHEPEEMFRSTHRAAPNHNCHKLTISAADPSRRISLNSNSPHEDMLKRSNALPFFPSLRITMEMLMKLI